MKTIFVILFVLLCSVALTAQTVLEEWVASFQGRGRFSPDQMFYDIAQVNDMAVDNLGNVYVTGQTYGQDSTFFDCITIKYNSSGTEEWVATYDGTGHRDDRGIAIAVDNAGNVYVTGWSDAPNLQWDYITIKYNATGVEEWIARYDGPLGLQDNSRDIVVDNEGNVYVTGESVIIGVYNGNYDYCTIKYKSDGTELWVATYNGTGNSTDYAYALALDDSGNVYVTGQSLGGRPGYGADFITVRYNGLTGAEEWVARYDVGVESARDIAINSSGVYVSGRIGDPPGSHQDYCTIKYDLSSGAELWVATYNGPGNTGDEITAMALDDSGNVYVTGYSNGSGTSFDYATIKYNGSTGAELWVARYNGPGYGSDAANDIAVDSSGDVYVTGQSYGLGSSDYATIRYNGLTGAEEWEVRYNGVSDSTDAANVIALDNSGNVYVSGWSLLSWRYHNLLTIKYDQLTSVDDNNYQPGDFGLYQNYPNPFNPSTVIEYTIPENGFVNLDVYNLLGEKVASLVNEIQSAGRYEIQFDASGLTSGVYFYRMITRDNIDVKKMFLLR